MDKNKNSIEYSPKYIIGSIGNFFLNSLKIITKSFWKILKFLAVIILVFGVAGLIGGGYFYFSTVGKVPTLTDPNKIAIPQDSIIYDVNNHKIGVISSQRRYIVSGKEINPNIKNALVSIEDERYFNHNGVDFMGIARALWVNFQHWRNGGTGVVQGASTITQQYVRNAYLEPAQTIKRKLQEVTLAVQLEAQLSKQDILDRYLNVVYFGNGNYGIEAASRYYFNKSAQELTVPESAILAAVVNNANIYDPTSEKGRIKTIERSHLVLNKMYELGYIDRNELLKYKAMDMNTLFDIQIAKRDIPYPYYYDYVLKELLQKYSKEEIYTGGWVIKTTLSTTKYKLMGRAITNEIGKGKPTAAMADVDPQTGAVNAFWGGFNYDKSNFNLATQGKRQPGSSFKPFVYATAFKQGMRNNSPFSNAPLTITDDRGKPWHVVPDSSARTLEQGLAYSDNAMAARLIQKTGVKPVIKTAHDLGIQSQINQDLAISLGGLTYGVSPLEMANSYASFANNGIHNPVYSVESIETWRGDQIYKHKANPKVAVNTEIAAMMNKSLQGVVDYGTAANSISLKHRYDIAGKTGTTDDHADTWFVGYTPNFTASVWMGYPDSRKSMSGGAWGGTYTAKIWNNYASEVLKTKKKLSFPKPKGVVEVPILKDIKNISQLKNTMSNLGLYYQIKEASVEGKKTNEIINIESAGKLVPLGSTITITIAVEKFTVPNFAGMTAFEAVSMVNSKKINAFDISFNYELDDTITSEQSGTIFKQSLLANSLAPQGSKIVLTLKFQTPKPVEVIKKVPTPYIPTDSELANLNTKITDLNNQLADMTAKKDDLASQLLTETNKVKLNVPNFVGVDINIAKRIAGEMGFAVTVKTPTGTVTSQSIKSGTLPNSTTLVLTGGGILKSIPDTENR